MSQISKCPKVTVVLTYWEASGDVSELRYKSLLCFSSKRSYCILISPCIFFQLARSPYQVKDDRDKETSFRACKHNLFKQVVSIENDNNNKENKETLPEAQRTQGIASKT